MSRFDWELAFPGLQTRSWAEDLIAQSLVIEQAYADHVDESRYCRVLRTRRTAMGQLGAEAVGVR